MLERRRERRHPQTYQSQVNSNDYVQRGEYSPRWRLLELGAYINTSGRPSKQELSERCDSDVHRDVHRARSSYKSVQVGFRVSFL
jgi:hypothetical protein